MKAAKECRKAEKPTSTPSGKKSLRGYNTDTVDNILVVVACFIVFRRQNLNVHITDGMIGNRLIW